MGAPRRRRQRVLVTPREIAGVASGLQHCLATQGIVVDVLLRWPHAFDYRHRAPEAPSWRRLAGLVTEPGDSSTRLRWLVSLAARLVAVALIPFRYSAVIYVGPETLLRGGADRRWLRRRGVRIVTVFTGSDARPPYLDGAFAKGTSVAELERVRELAITRKALLRLAERESDHVVNQPGTGQFHRQPYIDWTVLGFPSNAESVPLADDLDSRGSLLTVVHAPSDPHMKGSDRIRTLMQQLRTEGRIDYVEVSGKSHDEVLTLIRNADLVIDQLYSDVLLPGLATEAARLGTPVLLFGYAGDLVRRAAVRSGLPAVHYDHPDALERQVRRVLDDAAFRSELGRGLHRAVTTAWSAKSVGERWASVVRGEPDPGWFDEPDGDPYGNGCAIAQERLVAFLSRYVEVLGEEALCLDEAPRCRSAVMSLAAMGKPTGHAV
jgi:hypothetical protein